MTIAEALSARLTELMEEKHLTAYRLSMLTGVNQTTIGDIKHKRNVAVNVRVLFELCQGLGIEIVEFFNSPLCKFKMDLPKKGYLWGKGMCIP